MIFNKKDIIEQTVYSEKDKRYHLSFGFQIHCSGMTGINKEIIWWECKLFYPAVGSNPDHDLFKVVLKFSVRAPWNEDKMLKALEEELVMNSGKQRLIRAIYNDFGA